MVNRDNSGVTILGLGPGDLKYLTLEAWQVIQGASEIYLRTARHPIVEHLPPHLAINSFDALYESADDFKSVYQQITNEVVQLAQRPGGVIYAVPGHPYVAETTCSQIVRRAGEAGLPVRIVDGVSFLEPTLRALNQDALPQIVLLDALDLVAAHVPSFPPSAPAIIAQLYSRDVAADVKLTLMSVYPDEYPVRLVHAAGTEMESVEELPLFEIDRSPNIGVLTSLFIPPLGPATSFEAFQELIAHLRAPDGCPWDREQTHQTLRAHLLEEAYELLTALDEGEPEAIREELGDLLLQIVLHAQIASEYGDFNMAAVLQAIHTKIVGRHPHVFGDLELSDVDGILLNWERLKAAERVANGNTKASLLDGVAKALPALVQAEEFQKRAARVGFDWTDIQGVIDKVCEEVEELRSAPDAGSRTSELGDLLFAVVNLARWLEVDAESALREANARFRSRFAVIESAARDQGRELSDLSTEEMESLWQSAKGSP